MTQTSKRAQELGKNRHIATRDLETGSLRLNDCFGSFRPWCSVNAANIGPKAAPARHWHGSKWQCKRGIRKRKRKTKKKELQLIADAVEKTVEREEERRQERQSFS